LNKSKCNQLYVDEWDSIGLLMSICRNIPRHIAWKLSGKCKRARVLDVLLRSGWSIDKVCSELIEEMYRQGIRKTELFDRPPGDQGYVDFVHARTGHWVFAILNEPDNIYAIPGHGEYPVNHLEHKNSLTHNVRPVVISEPSTEVVSTQNAKITELTQKIMGLERALEKEKQSNVYLVNAYHDAQEALAKRE
jgi:hypothetical protein